MAIISAITDEYIYKFRYFYRKMVPKSQMFYIIFFLIKYFPLLLITHTNIVNCDPEDNLFTISKILSSLTILNNLSDFSYHSLCCLIYFVVTCIYAIIAYIIYVYYKNSKKTDYILYDIPNNKLFVPKYIKRLYKAILIVFFIVVFLYQHLFEILTYAVFEVFGSKAGLDINRNKMDISYSRNYVIVIFNIVYMGLLIGLLYFFFLFTSSETLSYTYGYQSPTSIIGIIFYCMVFSFQGLYTTSYFLNKDSQKTFQLGLLYLSVVLLLLNLFNNFNEINFMSTSNLAYFLRVINNFCLCSGILEILIHFFASDDLKKYQIFWFIILIVDLTCGIITNSLISKWQRSMSLRKLANAFFLSNKTSCPVENLFEFYLEMKNLVTPQKKFLFILTLVQDHQVECNLDDCKCHEFKRFFVTLKNKENIDKLINKFINMGEKKIMEAIINQVNTRTDSMSLLVFIHCDFMFSIQKNMLLCMYLCQYYLIKKRKEINFKYSYLIYELNKLSMKRENELIASNDDNVVSFIQENLIFEKIKKLILILCGNIESLLYYKSIKNSNSKMIFTCENIINPLIDYIKKNAALIDLLKLYAEKNIFEHSIEIKFLVYYHLKLFRITLPPKTMNKIYDGNIEFPSYNEIFTNNAELNKIKNNYIIVFLNCDNKFIIRYLSTEITESLLFSTSELVGGDFNEILIPKYISQFHSIQMKQYILEGNVSFSKRTFFVNKNEQLFPAQIDCKILPTINTLYSMIINISDYNRNKNYHNYYALLDPYFNSLFVSQSFEDEYMFNIKMMDALNINFCDFFGVDKDELNKYFSNLFNERITNISHKKPLATTSIRNDELFYYSRLAEEKLIRGKLINRKKVAKSKVTDSLLKLIKNMEELGLENDWKKKIINLYEFKKQANITDDNLNIKKSSHYFFYDLKFQFKQIGMYQYYVTTISEYIEENKREENLDKFDTSEINESKNFNSNANSIKNTMKKKATCKYSLYNKQRSMLTPDNDNNNENNTNNGDNYANELNRENSQASLLNYTQNSSTIGLSKYKDKNLRNTTSSDESVDSQPVIMLSSIDKDTKYVKTLRLIEIILFCVVFILNIISIFLGLSTMNFTQNLFYVNAYAFFMTNDIFYASLSSISVCLIVDKKQTGNIDELNQKVNEGADDLMEHYHLLNERINKLIHKSQMREIYDILNTKEKYNEIKNNWIITTHDSTLINELYIFHYFLQNFYTNASQYNKNCRLEKYFYGLTFPESINYEDATEYATNEETFMYFIISNVVSNFSNRMEYLTKRINVILNKYIKMAKTYSITFNVSILISGAILYIFIILSIQASRNLFRKRLVFIFTKQDKEEMFFDDIKRFKNLIENFDKKECLNYTQFKNQILGKYSHYVYPGTKSEKVFKTLKTYESPETLMKATVREDKKVKKTQSIKFKKKNNVARIASLNKASHNQYNSIYNKNKELDEDLEESIAKKEEKTAKAFYDKAEPRYVFLSMLFMLFIFGVFTVIEAINILKNLKSYNGLMIENDFATNILSRGPKINELMLYSMISVIVDNHRYISKNQSTYKDNILSNHYNVDLNLETNSLFKGLEDSNFGYLYYQLHIIRTNIELFVNDKKMKNYLKTTNANEFIFNEDSRFCLYSAQVYYSGVYDGSKLVEFYSELNKIAKKCKEVGNGMNLSGYKAGINLILQQLSNLYKNFVTYNQTSHSSNETRQSAFLMHNDILMIELNIIYVIQTLHFADAFSTIFDIENSYKDNKDIQIIFSVLSITFSSVIILICLLVITSKLDFYNSIVGDIAVLFETNIRKYNKLSELNYS